MERGVQMAHLVSESRLKNRRSTAGRIKLKMDRGKQKKLLAAFPKDFFEA
jgi:hypothetical protein